MAKACIGLDLGSSAVKLAELARGRDGSCELLAFGIEPIPSDSIVDGTIMNQSAVVDAVRALYARLRLRRREVALAIAGHSVIIKKIAVAPMSPSELDARIPIEAERHVPFAKDDVELDFQALGTRTSDGQMEVLLVAAKKEVVRDFAAVAREAQLQPVVVDLVAFALQNAFEVAYEMPPPGEAAALINVGAHTSNIHIVSGGVPAFTRDINTGSALLTEEIERLLNIGTAEAEALKLAVAGERQGAARSESTEAVVRLSRQKAEEMAGEFAKSLDFFIASHPDTQVNRIYLAGGGARSPYLKEAVGSRAHLEVEVMDPFRKMRIPEGSARVDRETVRSCGAQGAVAVGLALRQPGDKFS